MSYVIGFKLYSNIANALNSHEHDSGLPALFQEAFHININSATPHGTRLYVRLLIDYLCKLDKLNLLSPQVLVTMDDFKLAKRYYETDPSNFHNMFIYGVACMLCGNHPRAIQLFDRLKRTHWTEKDLAITLLDHISLRIIVRMHHV